MSKLEDFMKILYYIFSSLGEAIQMPQYLQYIPKTLQEDLINNKFIPIVVFSKNAIISPGISMSDGNQLEQRIASYIMDCEYTIALDALSIFESEYSRIKLI